MDAPVFDFNFRLQLKAIQPQFLKALHQWMPVGDFPKVYNYETF